MMKFLKQILPLATATLSFGLGVTVPALAQSLTTSTTTVNRPDKAPVEVSLSYTTLRTNASVGQCGCFWNTGATLAVAVPIIRHLAAVGEASGTHAGSVPGSAAGLSLISGMGGVRVPLFSAYRLHPFAQALVGGVHAFNSYFPATPTANTSASSFAMAAGGGVAIPLNGRFAVPIQADYQYMQLPNTSTNQQHDIRLSAGITYSFGSKVH